MNLHLSQRMIESTQWHVRPAKTQISLGIHPVWSDSLPSAQWVAKDLRFLHADSEDSDQTGRMPRMIWVFAGCKCHFVGFVLLWLFISFIRAVTLENARSDVRSTKTQISLRTVWLVFYSKWQRHISVDIRHGSEGPLERTRRNYRKWRRHYLFMVYSSSSSYYYYYIYYFIIIIIIIILFFSYF